MHSFRKCLFLILIFCLPLKIYSQGFDADSVFENDPAAQQYFNNFDTQSLDNVNSWDNIITYKDLGWKQLSMRIINSKTGTGLRPCLVFIHGGSWQTRALNQHLQYAWYFSTLGFTGIAVEYRVFNDGSVVTPQDEVEDVKSAIRYIRKNYENLNVDTTKIVAVGMSAGGHLAASTVYIEGFDAEGENINISEVPNALILQNPVIDLSSDGWVEGHNLLGDDWLRLSPLQHIDSECHSVPSLLMSGSSDNLVPIGGMKEWDLRYESRGCENQLYIFDGRGHGFGNYAESKSGSGHRDFIYCCYFMKNFLDEKGFLIGNNPASLAERKITGTRIYPNPAGENLVVFSDRIIESVVIFSPEGKAQRSFSLNSGYSNLDIHSLGSGLMFVKILYRNGSTEVKYFIKQ